MDHLLAFVFFLGATLFFVGYHNVDLIFNGCLWADMSGIDCAELKDRNAFVLWSFPDGYTNGIVLMIASFLGTVSAVYLALGARIVALEKDVRWYRDLHELRNRLPYKHGLIHNKGVGKK